MRIETKRRLVLLMVMAALVSTAAPSIAEQGRTRTVTKNYRFGFLGELILICDTAHAPLQSDPAIGGACFVRDFGEIKVTVTIRDDEGWPVGGFYDFNDPFGQSYGVGDFCDSVTLDIPPGSIYLNINLVFPDSTIYSCGLDGRPGTNGTITAEFYRPWP